MKAKFRVIRGKPAGLEIPITSELLIGRADDCDIRPATRYVSRHHALVSILDGRVWVRDLASRGGTYVNDDRLMAEHSVPLKHGDELKIGPVVFRLLIDGPEPAKQPSAAQPAPTRSFSEDDISAWLVGDEQSEVPRRPEDVDPGRTDLGAGVTETPPGGTAGSSDPKS